MARTQQNAKRSTGGKALKNHLHKKASRKTAPISESEQRRLAVAAANEALLAEEAIDEEPRVTEDDDDDCRVSRSRKSEIVTGTYNGARFKKIVPRKALEAQRRFDEFTPEELAKPANERMRSVRLIKVLDDKRGALVEWMDGIQRWEIPKNLMWGESTCQGWLDIAAAFMNSSEINLIVFLRTHPLGLQYDGADEDGLCAFRAVQGAMKFWGVEVTEGEIQEYVTTVKIKRGLNLTQGTNFAEVRRFILFRQLPVDLKIAEVNLFRGGANGVSGIQKYLEGDGLYLVSIKLTGSSWGHVIAVWKAARHVFAMYGNKRVALEDLTWVDEITYIRRLVRKTMQ